MVGGRFGTAPVKLDEESVELDDKTEDPPRDDKEFKPETATGTACGGWYVKSVAENADE